MPRRQGYVKQKPDEVLMQMILRSGLRAGDRLPTEDALAETLQMSRNSVREAVRELRAVGILDVRHPQGTFLRDASLDGLTRGLAFWARFAERDGLDAVQPIAEVREVLEVTLISRVVDRIGAADLREIERAVRDMEESARDGRYNMEADRRFHEAVFRPLANWVFGHLLESFWEVYRSVRHLVDRTGTTPAINAALHREILEALRRKDTEGARDAMIRHFDNSLHSPSPAAGAESDREGPI